MRPFSAVVMVLSALVLASCAIAPKQSIPAKVRGTITYLQQIVLPPEAVVHVRLEDVSKVDIAAERIREQVITNPDQVPIPFEIEYDSTLIDPQHFYAIQAQITVEGELWFASTKAYYVITQGHSSEDIEVILLPVK